MIVADGFDERVRPDGAIEWTIHHPRRRNAITPAALRFISRRCVELRGETVVLRGEGDGFCAGFDLHALREGLQTEPDAFPDAALIEATDALAHADATTIAALHGWVIGAGVELACACDLRIAADDVTFRVPAAALGVVYHLDGLVRLRATFGAAATRRLVLLGERLEPEQALQAGAVHRVVPRDDLAAAIDATVQHLRGVDRRSLAANRDALRDLDRGAVAQTVRERHQQARVDAYARLGPTVPAPARIPD
jgi:enoyl-CoA hydratase/carnithine racemase